MESIEETLRRLLLVLWVTDADCLAVFTGQRMVSGRPGRPLPSGRRGYYAGGSAPLPRRCQPTRIDGLDSSRTTIGRLASMVPKTTMNRAELHVSSGRLSILPATRLHELRTPLTVLKGETELVAPAPPPVGDYQSVLESNL